MRRLAARNRDRLIDLLGERLALERIVVRLYDKLLARMSANQDPWIRGRVREMQVHRAEQQEHAEWLEAQIRALGGDPHELAQRARLLPIEAMGIERLLLAEERPIMELLHALLAAELADNAGWDLLCELADEAGDREARRELKKRLREEEDHLFFVRETVARLAAAEVLGEELPMA